MDKSEFHTASASFAAGLQELKTRSGLTLWQLGKASGYPSSTMAAAARGIPMPTLQVTLAYVQACGGDQDTWREQWMRLRTLVDTLPPLDRQAHVTDAKVSPEKASTTTELATALRALLMSSGLTYRALEQRSGWALRRSTISDMLNGRRLMPWDTVKLFITACHQHSQPPGLEMDIRESEWLEAWQRAYSAVRSRPPTLIAAPATTANGERAPDRPDDHPLKAYSNMKHKDSLQSNRQIRVNRLHQDGPTEAEAKATARVIEGLRWRLRRQGTLEHPEILRELRKLEEQVTAQIEQTDRKPGRHRSPSCSQVGDAAGFDLKPDPLTASTPAEFVLALWEYKAWSGDPSWRTMARQSGQAVVHSTMYAAMHGNALPKFEVMKAIITGCGGSREDLRAFATAWRRLDPGAASTPAI
ncbi:MAG TPA: helix-turn-helix transcriptional regulator [Streptosporangiaceae bacterium]|nr:helix-turn-helix transcriptional regulator [Streptosporangiaceae bacterium]